MNKPQSKSKKAFKIFIDLLTIFIALVISDIIAQKINVSFWLYDFLIYLAILLVITAIGKVIESGFNKIKQKN